MERYSLKTYNRKRDFSQTSEPLGKTQPHKSQKLIYVIQKHHARVLHYDFRLNRPISVVRCPGGLAEECFYQRSKSQGMPQHIKEITLTHQGKTHDYIYIENQKGLIELVQMGVIEFHPWGSLKEDIERPDRIIFDLDPSPEVPFEAVKLAALDVKKRLSNLGLKSFAKVTGGKGIHITAPIQRKEKWDKVKYFARSFVEQMAKEAPQAYTASMSKMRRKGKIFIDFFRNDYAATAVGDYCVRSRPQAPVAIPIKWSELKNIKASNQFHIEDVQNRKKKAKEILKKYQAMHQSLYQ